VAKLVCGQKRQNKGAREMGKEYNFKCTENSGVQCVCPIHLLQYENAALTRENEELKVLREERPNLLKAVHESEHKIAALTRERETLYTIANGFSAANDDLKNEIKSLTRERDDLAARVGELEELLNDAIHLIPCAHKNESDLVTAIDETLSLPTPGTANRLCIEGMEEAAKIAEDRFNHWTAKGEDVMCGISVCIDVAAAIRSSIAEMEKGGKE
jgi:hypothetical protein